MFAITGIYAVVLAAWLIALGVRVSLARERAGVSLLDGGDRLVTERMRQHANAAETIPLAVILMGIAEAQGSTPMLVHAVGLLLVAGRLLHPFGISMSNPRHPLRAIGMSLTLLSEILAMGLILWRAMT